MSTDRLALRRLDRAVDARTLYDHRRANDEAGVYEFVPFSAFDSLKAARDALRSLRTRWDDGEGARYGVFERDGEERDTAVDASLLGVADCHCLWDRRTGHPGVILARDHWSEGYATECFDALLTLAFDRLDLRLVSLHHRVGNGRSRRAIERLVDRHGGQFDGRLRNWTPTDDGVADERRYTIRRDQYRSTTGH
nr:GNAT family protein [Halomarina rubra]